MAPKEVKPKWRNTVGAVVRAWMEPSCRDWRKMLEGQKIRLWTELRKAFQYLEGTEERAKKYALQQLGFAYRRFRKYLDDNYIKKGLTPFEEFGRITPAQWDELTDEEAKRISERNSASAKKNKDRPKLGVGGTLQR